MQLAFVLRTHWWVDVDYSGSHKVQRGLLRLAWQAARLSTSSEQEGVFEEYMNMHHTLRRRADLNMANFVNNTGNGIRQLGQIIVLASTKVLS